MRNRLQLMDAVKSYVLLEILIGFEIVKLLFGMRVCRTYVRLLFGRGAALRFPLTRLQISIANFHSSPSDYLNPCTSTLCSWKIISLNTNFSKEDF